MKYRQTVAIQTHKEVTEDTDRAKTKRLTGFKTYRNITNRNIDRQRKKDIQKKNTQTRKKTDKLNNEK